MELLPTAPSPNKTNLNALSAGKSDDGPADSVILHLNNHNFSLSSNKREKIMVSSELKNRQFQKRFPQKSFNPTQKLPKSTTVNKINYVWWWVSIRRLSRVLRTAQWRLAFLAFHSGRLLGRSRSFAPWAYHPRRDLKMMRLLICKLCLKEWWFLKKNDLPKTTCLLSKKSVFAHVMKNWQPFVSCPALQMIEFEDLLIK